MTHDFYVPLIEVLTDSSIQELYPLEDLLEEFNDKKDKVRFEFSVINGVEHIRACKGQTFYGTKNNHDILAAIKAKSFDDMAFGAIIGSFVGDACGAFN